MTDTLATIEISSASPNVLKPDTGPVAAVAESKTEEKTSFELFEQPNPDMVSELKYYGAEKLGRRLMFGDTHVGQVLPSKDKIPVLILDNGLYMSMQPIDHAEPGKWLSAFSSQDDISLPPNLSRTELATKLITTGKRTSRSLNDDILGLNMCAEFSSNSNDQNELTEVKNRLINALDMVDEKTWTRLPKSVNEVVEMLALRHRGKINSLSSSQTSSPPPTATPGPTNGTAPSTG